MATVGKNILDNLTTGMYSDSKVIYREYIQNACDQIDKAIEYGLLDDGDGCIEITIDQRNRNILIYDNATGVSKDDFIENLGDIANSNKELGEDKGFRGIGRLCGLAYCKTLKFITSAKGESVSSIMICDAQKMRAMLMEKTKYSLDEIWDAIVKYEETDAKEDDHFFEVQLLNNNKENTDLLNQKAIRDYLSFVAPVPYKNTFILRNQIYNHAKELDYKIDEYRILVDGKQIFKEYTTKLKEQNGKSTKTYDEISKLEFKDFYNYDGQLIAWMWVGLSRFEKSIPKINQMRGLRLRTGNIQLGNDDSVSSFFKEPRGNYYFVGEVFSVSPNLIPNSQRNYFNENPTRVEFEDLLRSYFYDVLHKLYYDANRIKNLYKKQEDYIKKVEEYNKKEENNGFVNEEARQKLQFEVEQSKKSADEARAKLNKLDNDDEQSPIAEVRKSIGKKYKSDKLKKEAEKAKISTETKGKKKTYATSDMSKLTRNERKIVGKIMTIITDIAPKDVAEEIIAKIKKEMR